MGGSLDNFQTIDTANVDAVRKYAPDAAAIILSTSTFGKAIPLVWGQAKLSANAIWSSGQNKSFGPFLSFLGGAAHCVGEGPIVGFKRAWDFQSVFQSVNAIPAPSREIFLGTYTQDRSAIITADNAQGFAVAQPDIGIGYRGLAYVVYLDTQLTDKSQIPNYTYEIAGLSQVGSIAARAKTITPDFTTSTLSATGHGFTEGLVVRITSSGAVPSGITAASDYYCANVTPNTFQLKVNPWDVTVVAFTDNGSGTITATPFIVDANPKDILTDYLTSVKFGAGFATAKIGSLSALSDYCMASGTFVSPALDNQEQASAFIERLMASAFSGVFFSEGLLKVVPYCDVALTGNGVTFTPNVSAQYALTDDDFIRHPGDDPIKITRKANSDTYNSIKIEYQNRLKQYADETIEVKDEAAEIIAGMKRPRDPIRLDEIKDPGLAKWVASLILFRETGVLRTYEFTLQSKYLLLEPMDIVTLTESTGTPLSAVPVRITNTRENEDGTIDVQAEDFPGNLATGVAYAGKPSSVTLAPLNASPGSINAPTFFVGPYALTGGALELWMGISGGPNFGGCDVFVSTNNADYSFVGRFLGKGTTGVTTGDLPQHSDPDLSSTLPVNLSESLGTLSSVTQAEADLFNTLAYVGGELVSFVNASPTTPNQYNLTALRRGVYGSTIAFAKSGAKFVYIGRDLNGVFRMPFPQEFNGRLLYFKFLAFNTVGGGEQGLSDVSPYTFTLTQQFVALPPMPIVSGLELFGGGLSTSFLGRDTKFAWRQASTDNSFDVGSEPFGGNSGGLDPFFKDYEVRMLTAPNGVVLRIEHTTDPFYTYTFEKNFEDNAGVPLRSFAINVFARGNQGQLSPLPAVMAVSNPAPAVPTAITTAVGPNSINVACVLPNETDVQGLLIWMSTSTGFTPGPGNLVYMGPDSQVTLNGLNTLTQYFFRIAAFDVFGTSGVNMSSEFSATTIFTVGGIQVVTSLPSPGIVGRVVYLTTDGKIYRDNGAAWVKTTDGADILANSITAASMNVAQLSAIAADLGAITAGSIRSANINSTAYTTKGSFLTSATVGADATVNVGNTADFPSSGSAHIVDTTNDRNTFTYSGKTGTTLTGCSGVLAHNNGATIIPLAKCVVVDDAVNEVRFYGDRGDGTIEELAAIGDVDDGTSASSTFIFGSASPSATRNAGAMRRPLLMQNRFIGSSSGTIASANDLTLTGGNFVRITGSVQINRMSSVGWLIGSEVTMVFAAGASPLLKHQQTAGGGFKPFRLAGGVDFQAKPHSAITFRYETNDDSWYEISPRTPVIPTFESSEQTVATSTNTTVAHSLGRVPKHVRAVLRCKTAELGYSVGDEVDLPQASDTAGAGRGYTLYSDATNVGFTSLAGTMQIVNRASVGNFGSITNANWKIVIYAW